MFLQPVIGSHFCRLSRYSMLVLTFILVGCAGSNGRTMKAQNPPAINYEFTGIPLLYFGYGSSVPLTPNLSLTAAHVAKMNYAKVVAYHPTCDVALIESDNQHVVLPELGLVYQGEKIEAFGVSGSGDVVMGKGTYHLDLNFVNSRYFSQCPASITDAPIRSGMSGGGAFNAQGELVGILAAIANKADTRLVNGEELDIERLSIFVSINFIQPWLKTQVNTYHHGEYQWPNVETNETRLARQQ